MLSGFGAGVYADPMPGKHFAVVLPEDEIAALADEAVRDLAETIAGRAFRALALDSSLPDELSEGNALARLYALTHIQHAVVRQTDQAARHAAQTGAGYPQLGQVSNMSRQGARRRWPGLVPTAKDAHQPGRASS
jgi:GGDEF domain-containing protein